MKPFLISSETGCGKRDPGSLWDDVSNEDRKESSFHDVDTPLLVIGTKQDLASDGISLPVRQFRKSYIAEEFGAEEIHLNCTDERALIAGTSSSNKLVKGWY